MKLGQSLPQSLVITPTVRPTLSISSTEDGLHICSALQVKITDPSSNDDAAAPQKFSIVEMHLCSDG